MKNCEQHKISIWRKLWLGPMITTNCKNCEKKVIIPLWAEALAIFPIIISMGLYNKLEGKWNSISLVIGVILSVIIQSILPIKVKK